MNAATTTPPDRKYAVFISYRHADNKEQGRQWATWLHHTLETYEVPPDLVGRTNLRGEPVPASLYPVFRDEEELPADADLSANIQRALRHSSLLVVLCSPRAVESRFVADEIRVFKELGKAGHILALMIDGEPNATDDPGKARTGIRPEHECLPEPLRYGVPRADGSIDWTQRTEPIAADVRPQNQPVQGWTTAAAYREELTSQGLAKQEIDRLSTAYEEQLQLATMKIIAGAIGLPLGEVTQRDKRHAEEKLKRARQELSRTEFLFARQLLDLKDYPKAYARLAKSLDNDPENRAAIVLSLEQIRRSNRGALRQFYHEDAITSAVFSPCGSKILTKAGNSAFLWDAATCKPLAEPLRHKRWVRSAAFSPDGAWILTASDDKSARLWDVASGRPISEPLRHENTVNSAVFSPDGTRILTGSGEPFRPGCALLWDAAIGRLIAEPFQHEGPVKSAIFSPDGTRILTACDVFGSLDHSRLWDTATGQLIAGPLRHKMGVNSAVFSPDGTWILTASDDKSARLWNAATCEAVNEPIRHEMAVNSAVFSPDGTQILTVVGEPFKAGYARLWDTTTGQPLAEPLHHADWVNSAVFSPDGTRILTASKDKSARLWNASTGQPITNPFRHQGGVRFAVFSPEGDRILTASDEDKARLWDATSAHSLADSFRILDWVNSAVFSSDGARILTASADGTARLWNASTGQPLSEPLRHENTVNSAVFSSDGARILTASADGTARLWNANTCLPPAEPFFCYQGSVSYAIFNPDGTRILTPYKDGTARLWDSACCKSLVDLALPSKSGFVSAVFSVDGTRILIESGGSAFLLEAASGQLLAEPFRHDGGRDVVSCAIFSPDGARILTASENGVAQLWDTTTGEPLAEPFHQEGGIRSVVFSPDGARILTSPDGRIFTTCAQRTFRLWDAVTADLHESSNDRLRRLLKIIGGCRLRDELELLEPISHLEIPILRSEFDSGIETNRLLRWWWSDPFTRTINPSSAITVPDYVRRRIREILDLEDEKAKPRCLQDARDAFLNHPLVLLCEAELGQCSDSVWLRQHAVSRLLAEPHYLTPLEPPNAIGDAKANRQYELTLGLAEDCFLGARLLLNDRTGQTRTTDPKRIELAKQVLARAMKLASENEAYRKLAEHL